MMNCAYNYGAGIICQDAAEATLNDKPLCCDHIHLYFPQEVEEGRADTIPGIILL